MKFFFTCTLALFIFACKGPHSITGSYKWEGGSIISTLLLDSANNFIYNSSAHLIEMHSHGKWWASKDTLFLKSNEDVTKENGHVTEEITNNFPGLTILNFFDNSGARQYNILTIINESDTIFGKAGLIKYSKPLNSVFVKVSQNYDFFYRKKDASSNVLNFYIDDFDNVNKYFILKKFLIKRNKLINSGFVYRKQ